MKRPQARYREIIFRKEKDFSRVMKFKVKRVGRKIEKCKKFLRARRSECDEEQSVHSGNVKTTYRWSIRSLVKLCCRGLWAVLAPIAKLK
jgi:hypothetical protein